MRPEVVSQISKAISTYLKCNDTADTPLPLLWDALKEVMRGEFIGISAADNELRREKRAQLQQQVTELNTRGRVPEGLVKTQLRPATTCGDRLGQGGIPALLLRHSYYVGSNRCSHLLANRLRAQHKRAEVTSIRLPGGPAVTSDARIISTFRHFYRDLYSAQQADLGPSLHYLEQAHTAKLMPEEASPLEAPISLAEVISAIAWLEALKSLRPDGFSGAFYKAFCYSFAPILTRLFNNIRELGNMPPSMLDMAVECKGYPKEKLRGANIITAVPSI
ncbi:hypothetical protein NDU88_002104 [Pleurodeles waltl]|uniref:Uncharacterized protein n=1 Tax=Pleurodeles waltl TaxID=8319 RepID=A0AAV7M1G0_PLEWA|nr:hypothetical protein NDU88_002104 [Pleurodeles waltl]